VLVKEVLDQDHDELRILFNDSVVEVLKQGKTIK